MWQTLAVYPNVAKGCEVSIGALVEDCNEVVPRSIAIGKCVQIFANTLAECLLAHNLNELLHHHRGLVVDDISVDKTCILEIVEWLAYRCGAERVIFGKRTTSIVLHKG